MRRVHSRLAMAGLFICASVGAFAACSSAGSSSGGATTDGGSSGDGAANGNCTTALTVLFSPMYSAYDGTHKFQVPAVVSGIDGKAVTWSVSDTAVVDTASDPDTGGIMLTMKKAGTVTVKAQAGGLCGSSTLTISQAAAADWDVGNNRYNDGIVLRPGPPVDGGAGDGGSPRQAACTNCHGPTATGAFNDVAHTPEQTGGFSDDELIGIFTKGQVPDGGYFDPSIVPQEAWSGFHKWDMTNDEAKGVVVYLRSLTPTPQSGSNNFGGRFDGGPPPEGGPFGPPDGG